MHKYNVVPKDYLKQFKEETRYIGWKKLKGILCGLVQTCVKWGHACDKDKARSPQTGEPLANISSDFGVMRRLSNLHKKTKNRML